MFNFKDRVRFINENPDDDSGFYPKPGAEGTVIGTEENVIEVLWDEPLKIGRRNWWVNPTDIERI